MSKYTSRDDRKSRRPAKASNDAYLCDSQAAGHRHERLTRLLREELDALMRDELTDPRLDGVSITVVELSVDYKNARVGFIVPAAKDAPRVERERLERLLDRATPFLRSRLAESVELKQVPALKFAWDAFVAAEPEGSG